MKFKIVRQTLPKTASRLFKLIKEDEEKISDVGSEFDRTFDSVGSGIKIVDGSFSTIKPIKPEPEPAVAAPSTSGIEFKPPVTSSPIYETISDCESNKEVEPDLDSTYNEEDFVASETASFDGYLSEVVQLITRTQDMLQEKKAKRAKLSKKLAKHKRKVTQIQNSIGCLDRMIKFGEKLPQLLDNI